MPAGSQDGKLLRVRGHGAPKLNASGSGDLLARVRVTVPQKLTKAERKALEELQKVSREEPRAEVFQVVSTLIRRWSPVLAGGALWIVSCCTATTSCR